MSALAPQLEQLVNWHLHECDFCGAEVQLLAFHTYPVKGECRTPAIPINLRVLAEALLHQGSPVRRRAPQWQQTS